MLWQLNFYVKLTLMLLILHVFIPIIELLHEELYNDVTVYIFSEEIVLILKTLFMSGFTHGR